MDNVGIYVGTAPKTVKAAHKAIIKILTSSNTDEKTKQIALKALSTIAGPPNGASISNTNINMEYCEPEPEPKPENDPDFVYEN